MPAISCVNRAVSALIAVAALITPALAQKVGVNSAVNPAATGTPPGAPSRQLVIGQEVVHNEHIITGNAGQTQILFLDESALTVGPNADVTIDNYVYDPSTGQGQLAMAATHGLLRFVGGKLSKNEGAVTLHTPSGVIGVRGGIFMAILGENGQMEVVFLYGKGLSVTGSSCAACAPQTITRPGFSVTIAGPGAAPSKPAPASAGLLASMLGQLNGKTGATGGSTKPPTDASVADSGIANTVSGNVAASTLQASLNSPSPGQPPIVNVGSVQSKLNISTVSAQSSSAIVNADQGTTPTGSQPVLVKIVGAAKSNNAPANNLGFVNQTAEARFTFGGTITYPPGAVLQNGIGVGTAPDGSTVTISPLTPGATTFVTATKSDGENSASGSATMTADGNFFFANLVSNGPGGDRVFIFGGTPVSQSFYAPTPTTRFFAFNVLPDATLGSAAGAQTIPFLPGFAGGSMPNAVVSPLYVAAPANAPFGSFNPTTNPNGPGAFALQASLAINGAGTGQNSALMVATGGFFTSSDTGMVVYSGPVRGTVMSGGTSPVIHIGAGSATVPGAGGVSLFGGDTIDGFVIDQNSYNTNTNFNFNLASAFSPGNPNITNYAFNQPVLAAPLPSNVGVNRPALGEVGGVGGIMVNGAGFQYALQGVGGLVTNPNNNTLFALFAAQDAFTPETSGVTSMQLPFGTASGRNFSRSTYIDNNIYAASESASTPVTMTDVNGQTVSYPTFASGATTYPSMSMVSSGTVPGAADKLLPPGVGFCDCQYLQWGYWQANIPGIGGAKPTNTVQSSYINTWVMGQPTLNVPTTGTGNVFNGAAIGTVSNNGAVYLAAGAFNAVYNFGSFNGTMTISNFDNKTFTGPINGFTSGSQIYAASLTGTGAAANISGPATGFFFGPAAAETGGNFVLHAVGGVPYLASGVFAGKQ